MTKNAKRHRFGVSLLVLFIVFGLVFGAVGAMTFKSLQVSDNWSRVTGTVTDVSSHRGKNGTLYAPVVIYEVDGESYEIVSRSSSSVYPTIGAEREVAYNPNRPDQSKLIEGAWMTALFILFILIGIAFIVTGPVFFVRALMRSKQIRELLQYGHKIQGVVIDVRSAGRVNKKKLYRVVVSAESMSGGVKEYISDKFSKLGGLLGVDLQETPVPVDVFVDSSNEDQYYVDLADLPGLNSDNIRDLIARARKGDIGNMEL